MTRAGLPRWFRFLLAGGLAAGLNWLLRFPLSMGLPYGAAVLVANLFGMLVGFLLYRALVFGPGNKALGLQIRDFVLVNAASIVVVTVIAIVMNRLLMRVMSEPVAEALAHAAAIVVGAGLNYAGHSRFTFGLRRAPVEVDERPGNAHP